jgi:hypothetical protein
MPEQPTAKWIGASGTTYAYRVYALPVHFEPNQAGNYIYSKLRANEQWTAIYIGQGDLRKETAKRNKADCMKLAGATHLHGHLNSREQDRQKEEQDLLASHKYTSEPNGYN